MIVKAIIVGAGVAGLAAAVLLPNKVQNLTYTVYERNSAVVRLYIARRKQLGQLTVIPGRHMG